jgi:hypothetical protein
MLRKKKPNSYYSRTLLSRQDRFTVNNIAIEVVYEQTKMAEENLCQKHRNRSTSIINSVV